MHLCKSASDGCLAAARRRRRRRRRPYDGRPVAAVPCCSEARRLRKQLQAVQEAEGRAEYQRRQDTARLAEIEGGHAALEAQVAAYSASRRQREEELQALQGRVQELRCVCVWEGGWEVLPACLTAHHGFIRWRAGRLC